METKTVFVFAVMGLTNAAHADWSATFTGASDYLFNGVTQTDHQPAAQASLDWSGAGGIYAGAWASNVDFGDDTTAEVDGYLGYSVEYRPGYSIDAGVLF
ncbi:TorF family putative porin [Thiocystis minor]|uniref:TorF family putative porin n=1 Tax=Thiocystis minor TaxID=61597 RepID=UPI001F5D0F8E|nr:TorF family putative porin [Thiocystis minor]